MATRTATWKLPTLYADGTVIASGDSAKVVTHVFADGVKIITSDPGATSWTGDLTFEPGRDYLIKAQCEINGMLSTFSPEVNFQLPFQATAPPTDLTIS